MHSLLSGLLKLSRLGRAELNIKIIDMNELMSDVLSILQTQIKKAGAMVKIADLPPCRADEKQVNHVFSNILSNAVKFLDPGRKGSIEVSGYHDNNHTVYCVKDNGKGIAPEYQERIFDMFHRLEPSKNDGEGLGLNIAQKALERNRGKIWLESEPGRGSSFYVSIPPAVM
jgi:signal transduction histidine kinase